MAYKLLGERGSGKQRNIWKVINEPGVGKCLILAVQKERKQPINQYRMVWRIVRAIMNGKSVSPAQARVWPEFNCPIIPVFI
jgi:hypothetical protein